MHQTIACPICGARVSAHYEIFSHGCAERAVAGLKRELWQARKSLARLERRRDRLSQKRRW